MFYMSSLPKYIVFYPSEYFIHTAESALLYSNVPIIYYTLQYVFTFVLIIHVWSGESGDTYNLDSAY